MRHIFIAYLLLKKRMYRLRARANNLWTILEGGLQFVYEPVPREVH